MRILVTGGTGFLGGALLPLLARDGHTLRVLARGPADDAEALGAEVLRGSLDEDASIERALDGIEAVYHLAGQVAFDPTSPAALYQLHVQGTRRLLEACALRRVRRVVMASSSGTVAVSRTARVATEADEAPLEVIGGWPYYLSKLFQEKAALRLHRDTGLPLVVLNPSLLLGPGDKRLSSTDVVFKFLERRIPAMPGGGLSFVDVRDAAVAFAAALTRGAPGERYLLGGANLTFAEFFGRLERLSGVAAPRLRLPTALNLAGARLLGQVHAWRHTEPDLDLPSTEMGECFWYCESAKARDALGFAPRDAQETLFETVRWLDEQVRGRGRAPGNRA